MPTINVIPAKTLPVFVQLAEMSEEEISELTRIIEGAKPSMWTTQFATDVAAQAEIINPSQARSIAFGILSLYSIRADFNLSVQDMVDEIVVSPSETGEPAFTASQQEVLRKRLPPLLSYESLGVTSKATDVFVQHEHVFCNARLLTDIRPIFGVDPSEKPKAATIVHTLKIGYHQGREYKEFFVALDTGDVKTLQETLERDNLKAKSLRSLLHDSDVSLLDTDIE